MRGHGVGAGFAWRWKSAADHQGRRLTGLGPSRSRALGSHRARSASCLWRQGKILQLNTDKAALQQAKADLEARLRGAAQAAERQEQEAQAQRYELQSQLTEAHRKLESAQAEAVRAELYLEQERQSGSTAADASGRLQAQLDDERRGRQALAQQLAAEQALRQQSLTGQQALQVPPIGVPHMHSPA